MLPAELCDPDRIAETMLVNPTGRFVVGGPVGDAGLTGRKIIVDTYGGMARHGGGAFSGKDPSKVDRSAAYAARHVAKNVVAAGLAERCEVQVAYAIGVAHPVSLMVETFGTGKLPDAEISRLVEAEFDLRPGAFRRYLDLHRPIYQKTAAYGHFGRDDDDFTWERTDRAEALRERRRRCGRSPPPSPLAPDALTGGGVELGGSLHPDSGVAEARRSCPVPSAAAGVRKPLRSGVAPSSDEQHARPRRASSPSPGIRAGRRRPGRRGRSGRRRCFALTAIRQRHCLHPASPCRPEARRRGGACASSPAARRADAGLALLSAFDSAWLPLRAAGRPRSAAAASRRRPGSRSPSR